MAYIDLNCDMGEGFATDADIMPYISSTNIACGYHAGNEDVMKRTVALALQHKVAIGAHPGFADMNNFGRTEIRLSEEQLFHLVAEQLYLLLDICKTFNATLHHVKPHGALYNMAARDPAMSAVIANAIQHVHPTCVLYGLSGSHLVSEAEKAGLRTASEVFADRTYQDNGSLTSRQLPNALIEEESKALAQVLQMISTQTVTSVSGKAVPIKADTVCIHGDGVHAVAFAKKIHQTLQQHSIETRTI
ncbi:MAG: LamB/YcsF family protein [Bacteroidota bacterium]|nr:LamB/YcsF family protein [Bacteroidota bacterium]